MLFSANANRPGIPRLRCKEKMNFKNVQYYSGLFFAGLMILLSSNIQVADAAELTAPESIPTLSEETIFSNSHNFWWCGQKITDLAGRPGFADTRYTALRRVSQSAGLEQSCFLGRVVVQ